MTRTRVPLAVVAALSTALLALTGCASSVGSAPSAAPSADQAGQLRKSQAQLATCMKGKGFTYHPMVSMPELPKAIKEEMSGDYPGMKAYRSKYGFGFAASLVYPNDGVGRMARAIGEGDNGGDGGDPNGKVIAGLPKAQREAYFNAMNACTLEMINKATGRKLKSMEAAAKAQGEMLKQIISREIDGDAKLVELAGAFADCLKGKGYRVTSQRPSEIVAGTEAPFMTEFGKLGLKATAEQARPLLQREIKAALEDLECGKEFYAVYRPKADDVYERAQLLPGVGMMSMTVAK